MGIYLNPGADAFQEALRSKIYVDKTGLIAKLNNMVSTQQKDVCVSRPRRESHCTPCANDSSHDKPGNSER